MPHQVNSGKIRQHRAARRGRVSGLFEVVAATAALLLAAGSPADSASYRERLGAWLAAQGYGDGLEVRQVNIFGDGDPLNGTEDSRIDMSSPSWNHAAHRPWNMAAGTVHCDGKNRGSAMIVDTGEYGELRGGVIIATSAHVLYDLENKQRFRACGFHYMALDSLPGYQGGIEWGRSLLGRFDPADQRTGPMFGRGDWAFLYVPETIPGIEPRGRLKLRPWSSVASVGEGVSYRFIGYSHAHRGMAISAPCQVTESLGDDLGGGAWAGQLLDDCDSEEGASGGGLVASFEGDHYLVGIRSGSHWDRDAFPQPRFPSGPPPGAAWDRRRNTNFSRAIDGELIEGLRELVLEIRRGDTKRDSAIGLK